MTTDKISNTITRIRNANSIKSRFVLIPNTKLNFRILNTLSVNKFIIGFEKIIFKNQLFLFVYLNSNKQSPNNNTISINNLERISKPSLRIYLKFAELKNLSNKKKTIILSTSKGIMSITDCIKNKIGGEPLFYIW